MRRCRLLLHRLRKLLLPWQSACGACTQAHRCHEVRMLQALLFANLRKLARILRRQAVSQAPERPEEFAPA